MPPDIKEFQGDFRWLSNFWPAEVVLEEQAFPTVENAYQAAKVEKALRDPFITCSPAFSKKLGRLQKLREDWEEVKISVMRDLISQKFCKGSRLSVELLATEDAEIVEGNWWNDTFWGVCRGVGENTLGKLLMEQRAFLKELNDAP